MPAANATARAERDALCDLFLQLGPDAPTRCAGWRARDLAAHLVLRERRPDAAAGIQAARFAGHTAKVQAKLADTGTEGWAGLVEKVRSGPPGWSPMRVPAVDGMANTLEFFVHHEDLRRGTDHWDPRTLDAETVEQLSAALARAAKLITRRSTVGVVLHATDGPDAGTDVVLREGNESVTLVGPVSEAVLAVFGRPTRGLTVEGSAIDVAAFTNFPR